MSRFSFGDRPLSQALRACTISVSQPEATTAQRALAWLMKVLPVESQL